MKKWEEIIKEKIDEPSGNLPESVFEEFHARLEAGRSAAAGRAGSRGAKRRPLLWALAPATAAGLAAVLLIRQPSAPQDAVQVAPQSATPVAAAVATVPLEPAEPAMQSVAPGPVPDTDTPVAYRQSASSTQDTGVVVSAVSDEEPVGAERTDEPAAFEPAVTPKTENQPDNYTSEPIPAVSPYKPEGPAAKPVTMKVAPAAGIVAGSGLLTAVASYLLGHDITLGNVEVFFAGDGAFYRPTGGITHHPALFKGGLSVGIPLADRLKIVTGLEYSQYRSSFESSLNSVKARDQLVRYLGVPVRLDWSLAKGKMFDVYVGAGAQADYCIGAMISGGRDGQLHPIENIKKDGFVFSLLAAGGIQVNVNKRMGFYLEPELAWTGGKPTKAEENYYPWYVNGLLPGPDNTKLQTYRTEHPFMFSISTGLRINLGK